MQTRAGRMQGLGLGFDLWPFDLRVSAYRDPSIDYMSTDFGANSLSRFPFRAGWWGRHMLANKQDRQTDRQTRVRDWTPDPTPAAIQPAWVNMRCPYFWTRSRPRLTYGPTTVSYQLPHECFQFEHSFRQLTQLGHQFRHSPLHLTESRRAVWSKGRGCLWHAIRRRRRRSAGCVCRSSRSGRTVEQRGRKQQLGRGQLSRYPLNLRTTVGARPATQMTSLLNAKQP